MTQRQYGEELDRLVLLGVPVKAIVERLGCNPSTAYARAIELSYTRRSEEEIRADLARQLEGIVRRFNRSLRKQ